VCVTSILALPPCFGYQASFAEQGELAKCFRRNDAADLQRIISLNVYVADRCCDVCSTQLTQLLVFVRDDSPVIRNQLLPFTESELRQGRHILADSLVYRPSFRTKERCDRCCCCKSLLPTHCEAPSHPCVLVPARGTRGECRPTPVISPFKSP